MKTKKKLLHARFSKLLNNTKRGCMMLPAFMFMLILPGYAQKKPVPVGSVTEFYKSLKPEKTIGKPMKPLRNEVKVESGKTLTITINNNRETYAGEIFSGYVEGSKKSHAFFTLKNGEIHGNVIMPEKKKAYKYSSENGTVFVVPEDIDKVICVEYNRVQPSAYSAISAGAPPAGSAVYNLESLPGATAVVMLDFDGHDATGSNWGNIIALPANVTESDIQEAWNLVSEDFRAYQLNITTSEAVYQAAPANRRMRCVITPTTDASPNDGGVAFVPSFTTGGDLAPCWVFNGSSSNGSGGKDAGETASHEIGHTMGLSHDGRFLPDGTTEKYYGGHGNWGPIMGYTGSQVTQWSKGEYQYANNTEDDIAIIGTNNGFGFRTDDAGNTVATAKQLIYSSSGEIDATANLGIVGSRTDVDVYKFTTTGGTALINAASAVSFVDLDIELTLKNSSGATIATINPANSLDANLALVLAAGTYYLSIDGVGAGDPFLDGYSDYSSLGQYKITGNVQLSNTPPTVSLITPVNGSYLAAPATFELSASVSDLEGPIAKVEFYQDNVKIGEDAFYPGFGWTVNNLAPGIYTFTAKVFDQGGLTTVSAPVTVTVDGQPPVISIVTPANNAQFTAPASFSISTSVSDGQGPIKKVEFYQNNIKIGEDDFYPGFGIDIANLGVGTYTFIAKAFDQANLTATASVTVVVVASPCILNEPAPPATQFVLRNSWYDQQSGSNISNESGTLKIVQRAYGQNELWVLESGKTINVTNGQVYNVKMDFKDFQTIGVSGIELGFATGIMGNGSGPVLSGNTVSFPPGFSSANFVTKSVNITSAFTGSVFLAIKLKWNSQPVAQVTDYIKNLAVCTGAGPASRTLSAAMDTDVIPQGITIGPNPSETNFNIKAQKDITLIHVTDLQGKTVYTRENAATGTEVIFGENFSSGFYIVKVSYSDGSQDSFKIVKTH